jgi:NADH:ubiquinone oxidoreductase subunit E
MNKIPARIQSLQDLQKFKKAILEEKKKNASRKQILLCAGAGCIASGSLQLKKALEAKIREEKLDAEVIETGCLGPCAQGPVIVVNPGKPSMKI